VQEQRSRLRQMLGPEMAESVDDGVVRQQTLDQMVSEQLLLQAAADSGMRIGDAQLAAEIQSQEIFRGDDGFSPERYENFLRQQGYSPGGFEQMMRQGLLSGQITNGLVDSAIVTEAELARMRALQGQQRSFRTLEVPVSRFMDVSVSEEAIARHYEENKARYVKPEQVAIEYLEISRPRIAAGIPVDDAELLKLYQARQANYGIPEQRKVSHILLSLASDADDSTVEDARNKLLDIRRQIESGASFEAMAKAHSDDPGTAESGGDLGFISRGIMDPAFESAAFSLEAGALSQPVRSAFGLHLIQVTEIRESRTRSFEQVKSQLKTEFQSEQADLEFSEQVERLANLAFEHPESLDIAAETLGLEIKTSSPFSREGAPAGIASNPEVVSAAFSEDVLEGGNNSEVLELGNGVVVALRVKTHEPAAPLPLDTVRDQIAQELKQRTAREKATETGRSLLEKLRNGESPEQVAASENVQWSETSSFSRQSDEADPGLRALVFRMPKPEQQARTYAGRSLPSGGFQIVALESVRPGPFEGQQEAAEDLRRSMAAAHGSTALEEYSRALREEAEVIINHENLQGRL
ncbi:MAG TPA: peptidyl-prolyl cis-trans isomerase, partial [Gammaproteobacteria bacterium]|nr:peptidyl-prolyl cis-trans isomerase [Gammaproteobacteria bacterium]